MKRIKLSDNNVDIDWLSQQKEISSRAVNVCYMAGIKTINDLKAFHEKHSRFSSIRGCGKKTNRELVELCNTDLEAYINNSKHIIPSPFTERQFEYEVELLFKISLGIRAQNAMLEYLGDSFTIENIEKRIIFAPFSDIKLNNVGKKTSQEIQNFIQKIIALYHTIERALD
ncbi:MAG: hypothetical protein J0L87_06075 [Bacteroidetes bacterium]|nr:hypothetical protein [Bacteroidota bacterium]